MVDYLLQAEAKTLVRPVDIDRATTEMYVSLRSRLASPWRDSLPGSAVAVNNSISAP
jgi:hypothetical protein